MRLTTSKEGGRLTHVNGTSLPRFKLLGLGTDSKTAKSNRKGDYLTAILYLAPANESGYNVCQFATEGCKAGCLYNAGLAGVFPAIKRARIRKTRQFMEDKGQFLADLHSDIAKFQEFCRLVGASCAIRLNGTSDLPWERIDPSLFKLFPFVRYYDYTKSYKRALDNREWCGIAWPENYDLTFSRSESNEWECHTVLQKGGRVAVVFDKQAKEHMPSRWYNWPVISGDDNDLTFTKPVKHVLGLYAKGRNVHLDPARRLGFILPVLEN